MKYKQILLGMFICIILEFGVYQVNHKLNLFKPFFVTTLIKPYGSYEVHQGGGNFTNPLLECQGVGDSDSTSQLNISQIQLQDFVNKAIASHGLDTMSVYVRDLNNGPWVGVNQTDDFLGGSLLKVPILISYLKMADSDPSILKKEIHYATSTVSNVQYYTSSKQLEVGKTYTIEQLLEYMTYYSDNNAAYLLSQNLGTNNFNEIFKALGFGDPDPNVPYPVNTITYSSFFRILFNASYLSKANSEKALSMLSRTEFNRGIQEGLPNNIVVSHKFGIRTDNNVNQLHDCGVVYYPGHPYLLCIMSRGGTFDDMSQSIGEVSKFVYNQISAVDATTTKNN